MDLTVGIDLVENVRIEEIYKKFGNKFLQKIFTDNEVSYCLEKVDPIPHLSGRFCVKEAFIKALNPGKGVFLDFREIELKGQEFENKNLEIYGKSKEYFLQKGFDTIRVSISHERKYSTAVVILFKK